MKRRKSYLTNFPTSTLFIVLEQNVKELLELEVKQLKSNNVLLTERISQIKLTINIAKTTIIERYLNNNVSIIEIANSLLASKGIKEEIFQELLTLKLLESNEIISVDLLKEAIDKLDTYWLILIIRNKQDTIYGNIAAIMYNEKYEQMIFDVEPEVYQEYVKKIDLDRKGEF